MLLLICRNYSLTISGYAFRFSLVEIFIRKNTIKVLAIYCPNFQTDFRQWKYEIMRLNSTDQNRRITYVTKNVKEYPQIGKEYHKIPRADLFNSRCFARTDWNVGYFRKHWIPGIFILLSDDPVRLNKTPSLG